jgi:hypothetical protein
LPDVEKTKVIEALGSGETFAGNFVDSARDMRVE